MKPTVFTCLSFLAILPFSNYAAAQSYGLDRGQERVAPENFRRDRARVTRVERVSYQGSQYDNDPYLRQECWDERTQRHESGYYRDESGHLYRGGGSDKTTRTLLGALIGGALGNQVGDGDGRTAATIAGAVIGAQVGKNSGQGDRGDHYDRYRDASGMERRCRTIGGDYSRDAYRVTYTYSGQSYQAITNDKPGRTLWVLVNVRPETGQIGPGR